MKKWIITVKALEKELHPLDKNVPGEYYVSTATEEKALDYFHAIEPIKVLEDFDISIKEETHGNKEKDS
jgi:hypothetical protein